MTFHQSGKNAVACDLLDRWRTRRVVDAALHIFDELQFIERELDPPLEELFRLVLEMIGTKIN